MRLCSIDGHMQLKRHWKSTDTVDGHALSPSLTDRVYIPCPSFSFSSQQAHSLTCDGWEAIGNPRRQACQCTKGVDRHSLHTPSFGTNNLQWLPLNQVVAQQQVEAAVFYTSRTVDFIDSVHYTEPVVQLTPLVGEAGCFAVTHSDLYLAMTESIFHPCPCSRCWHSNR